MCSATIQELTYVMSWAMRHILPARDSASQLNFSFQIFINSCRCKVAHNHQLIRMSQRKVWYHPMFTYFRLLDRACRRKTGWWRAWCLTIFLNSASSPLFSLKHHFWSTLDAGQGLTSRASEESLIFARHGFLAITGA